MVLLGIIFSNPNTKPPINKPVSVSSVDSEPFYVGVTYCGDSVYDAKQLIDKVKNYTNLFVLQSGTIQSQPEKINEIVDYAVDSNLYFMVYFGSQHYNYRDNWLLTFNNQWNEKFLGVYYGDEPAGKMLDGTVSFWDSQTNSEIKKMANDVKVPVNFTYSKTPAGREKQLASLNATLKNKDLNFTQKALLKKI